ncbi:MAG: hypothetical protein LBU85_10815 [Treponema sp.]|jgi:Na+/proline symporter|nr:hypothetical protein [Treponema sp.]
MTGNIQTLIGMGGYLVVMIAIGLWYARQSNSNPEELNPNRQKKHSRFVCTWPFFPL